MQSILYYFKRYCKEILLYALLLISLGMQIFVILINYDNKDNVISDNLAYTNLGDTQTNEVVKEEKEILNKSVFVDIKGAIKKTGVYEMNSDSIVNDVVKIAGGYTTNAYQNGINLSKKIKDEMVIYIYTKSEMAKYLENNDNNSIIKNDCNTPDYNICECVNDKYSIIEVGSNNRNDSDNSEIKVININNAGVSELSTLVGIGESKAQAIIKYREDNGKFTKIEDIMNVSGIGEKAFEKIKDFITI